MDTNLSRDSLDGSRFVVDVFSELERETVQSRWEAVNTLLKLSMLTGLQMQLDPTLGLLCDYSHDITNYDSCVVYLWDETQDRYSLRLALGFESDAAESKFGPANIFNFWATKYSQPLLVNAGESETADAFLTGVNAASCLTIPLFVSNRVMGSMQMFSAQRQHFKREDAQLLWIMALVAENLLTRESTNEGLLRFAFTDYLTGLRSRGYFEQQVELEIKRAERKKQPFALMMMDIDHFKSFNDSFGHHVGDQVLRDVSSLLVKDMREIDTVARYGGEEFVIILPETGLQGALQVAERLRTSVEQTKFYAGDPAVEQRLSISIGLAIYGIDGRLRSDLIEAADHALYNAKSLGRNQVVTHSELLKQHRTGS